MIIIIIVGDVDEEGKQTTEGMHKTLTIGQHRKQQEIAILNSLEPQNITDSVVKGCQTNQAVQCSAVHILIIMIINNKKQFCVLV